MKNVAILLFLLSVPYALWANKAGPCEVVFSDPESFMEAMTKRLDLREGQDSLMRLYIREKTPYPEQDGGRSGQEVLDILEVYPELAKPSLREQVLEFSLTKRESPESLKSFIRSFNNSAGRIRNNLFNIEANLGFWMKMLGFSYSLAQKDDQRTHPQTVSPTTRGFIEWLNTTPLDQQTRDFIKDSSKPYWDRAIELYEALEQINEKAQLASQVATYEFVPSSKENKTQAFSKPNSRIQQAMAELVHTIGFGNESNKALLKSSNPAQSYEALRNILNERDRLAFDLGFMGHFKELKEHLSAKILDESKTLKQIAEDIQNQPHTVTGTEVLRLRSLSTQESPFRGCFGGDCASQTYFEKALDPNFLYFTLTDGKHRSFGQVTIVLGTAQNEQGQKVKTAFLDKIQGVRPERLQAMLEGVRRTLKKEGYVLAIPKEVGDIHTGLSNEIFINTYVETDILPNLKENLKNFKPHKHKHEYEGLFDDQGYSRAEEGLTLLTFEGASPKEVTIKPGPLLRPKLASPTLNVRSLYKPILLLRKSTKEAEQLKFLSHLLNMHNITGLNISDQYVRDHLSFVLNTKGFSFKVRKQALLTLFEFGHKKDDIISLKETLYPNKIKKTDVAYFLDQVVASFSPKERKALIGEMSNWKNTTDYRKQVIEELSQVAIAKSNRANLNQVLDSPWGPVLDKGYMLFSTIRDFSNSSQYINATAKTLLDKGMDVHYRSNTGETILMWATFRGFVNIVQLLLKNGTNVNDKNEHGETALMRAIQGDSSQSLQIMRLLINNGANVNAKTEYGETALLIAADKGAIKSMRLLLNRGADINAVNNRGMTPLTQALYQMHIQATRFLVKRGASLNMEITLSDIHLTNTVFDYLYGLLHNKIQRNTQSLLNMKMAQIDVSAVLKHPIFPTTLTGARSASAFLLEKGEQIKKGSRDKKAAFELIEYYEQLIDLYSFIQSKKPN